MTLQCLDSAPFIKIFKIEPIDLTDGSSLTATQFFIRHSHDAAID
jgi:hypothetical protein